jgi:hypothetical protein
LEYWITGVMKTKNEYLVFFGSAILHYLITPEELVNEETFL